MWVPSRYTKQLQGHTLSNGEVKSLPVFEKIFHRCIMGTIVRMDDFAVGTIEEYMKCIWSRM